MEKEIAKYLLKKLIEKGSDDVVISYVSSEAKQIKFVNNEIVKTGTEYLRSLNVFASLKKRLISTTLKDITKKSADNLVDNILNFSKNIRAKDDYYGIAKGPFKYKKIEDLYEKNYDDIDMVDLTVKGINASLENAKRASGILEGSNAKIYLTTSNNVELEYEGTHLYFSIRAFYDKESSGHKTVSGRTLKKFNVEKAGLEAGKVAKDAKNPIEGKPGRYDVILDPLASAPLFDAIGNSSSIFNVETGTSFFGNRLNKKVADSGFTMYDDPTYPDGLNSIPFDSEGYPTIKNTVIKNGVFKTYLHNTSTAKKYNTKNTGNAGLIAPEPTNILIDKGRKTREELIKNVKNGLYITNVWYTRFTNYATGDFSTIPRDGIFLIKKGNIEGSIKNIRISENMLNILNNLKEKANDIQQIRSWEAEIPVIIPSILVKNMRITGPVL
ncbi:TldD/PmbA family protein [Candidatus Woesearchaeota archaeon]|nr:TldD/PmbA family protein [Candidatus Woesearchaeota archaeon]